MKLRVHLILPRGRFIAAGEQIDEREVPANLRRYAIVDDATNNHDEQKLNADSEKRPRKT